MHITMVGTGYVGLVTGSCFANTGNDVTCLDIDPRKIDMLNNGQCPIYEPGLEEIIKRNAKAGRLHFTTDKAAAYQRAEVIFICVGTPSDAHGNADLKYVVGAGQDIGQAIEKGSSQDGRDAHATDRRGKIIVIKSTVPVGTNALVKAEIAKHTKKPFHMASNPEFLKEGAAIQDFNRPDRVVLGVEDKGTGDRMRDIYEPFVRQGNPIFVMDVRSAEMVKYAANAMLATKISFINEIANLCESYGADIDEVRRGMCSDKRIGNQFLYPGLGYGGSCFPKDVLAVISMAKQKNSCAQMLSSVHDVNQKQRDKFMSRIDEHFAPGSSTAAGAHSADLKGKRIAVWGIAFKPHTDDIREAPAVTLIQHLVVRGAKVVAFDPVAMENCKKVMGDKIEYASEMTAALDGAEALVICTDWDEFRQPDLEAMKRRMKSPVIFDGRNLYRLETMQEAGFIYHSVGRKTVGA